MYKCEPINKHSQRILPAFHLPVDCLLTFPNVTCTVQYIIKRHANRALRLVRIRQWESVLGFSPQDSNIQIVYMCA